MKKTTWLSSDLHKVMAPEIDQLVADQAFLEQFYAVSLLLNELNRDVIEEALDEAMDDESLAS